MELQGQASQGVSTNPAAAYEQLAVEAANAHGLDPDLFTSLVKQESGFKPHETSNMGAMGLTQLMPGTAKALGVDDPYDPVQNIDGGARYFKQQLNHFGGDVGKALAAYNAGPGAVEAHGGIPPYAQTQHYVQTILNNAMARGTSYHPKDVVDTLPAGPENEQPEEPKPFSPTDPIEGGITVQEANERNVTFQNALNTGDNKKIFDSLDYNGKKQILDGFKEKYFDSNPKFNAMSPEEKQSTLDAYYKKYAGNPPSPFEHAQNFLNGFIDKSTADWTTLGKDMNNPEYAAGRGAGDIVSNLVAQGVGGLGGAVLGGLGGTAVEPGGGTVAGAVTGAKLGASALSGALSYVQDYNERLRTNPHEVGLNRNAHALVSAATMAAFPFLPEAKLVKGAAQTAGTMALGSLAHSAIDQKQLPEAAKDAATSAALGGAFHLTGAALGKVAEAFKGKSAPKEAPKVLQAEISNEPEAPKPTGIGEHLVSEAAKDPIAVKAAEKTLAKHHQQVIDTLSRLPESQHAAFIEAQNSKPNVKYAQAIVDKANEFKGQETQPKTYPQSLQHSENDQIESLLTMGQKAYRDPIGQAKFDAYLNENYSPADSKILKAEIKTRIKEKPAQDKDIKTFTAEEIIKDARDSHIAQKGDIATRLRHNADIKSKYGKEVGGQLIREAERAAKHTERTPEEVQAHIDHLNEHPEELHEHMNTLIDHANHLQNELGAKVTEYNNAPRAPFKNHLNVATQLQSRGAYKTLDELLQAPEALEAFNALPEHSKEIMLSLDYSGKANTRSHINELTAKTGKHSSAGKGRFDSADTEKYVSPKGFLFNPTTNEFKVGILNNNLMHRDYFIQKAEDSHGIHSVLPQAQIQLEGKVSGAYREPIAHVPLDPYIIHVLSSPAMTSTALEELGHTTTADNALKGVLHSVGAKNVEIFNHVKATLTDSTMRKAFLARYESENLQHYIKEGNMELVSKELKSMPDWWKKAKNKEVPC